MLTRHKIRSLIEAQAQLKYWKEAETELRKQVAIELTQGLPTGTHHFDKLDYHLKVVKKNNTKLDKKTLIALEPDFTEEERTAVNYKPELSLSAYKKLEDHETIDLCIVVTPAMPEVVITALETK